MFKKEEKEQKSESKKKRPRQHDQRVPRVLKKRQGGKRKREQEGEREDAFILLADAISLYKRCCRDVVAFRSLKHGRVADTGLHGFL
jgi:hypothetical protein